MIPKKEGTVRFITEYLRLNHKLIKQTYLLPRIGKTMQQLEALLYATVLYLNMGYYTIRLLTYIQDTTTIVNGFGKYRHNRLPMGMCASEDIFQAKVDDLIGDTKDAKTYINDILVLIKDCFTQHIEKLRIIFKRLRTSDLKLNAPKCSFGLKDIPYLGFVITREGIKPNPKKLQEIIDIGRPTTKK